MSSPNDKAELTGYTTARKFGGYALPVPTQNLLLRGSCEQHNFRYRLPLLELYLPDTYMALHGTIDRCGMSANIGMCSIYMFPREINTFLALKEKIDNKKLQFHFIFERCSVMSDELEEFFYESRLRYLI